MMSVLNRCQSTYSESVKSVIIYVSGLTFFSSNPAQQGGDLKTYMITDFTDPTRASPCKTVTGCTCKSAK